MIISLVAAMAENRIIGKDNELPWYLPADLKRFRALTLNKPVLMGRKTYESIVKRLGKPLPDRTNIVLTGDANYSAEGCIVVHSIEDALNLPVVQAAEELMVIGGASLYALLLPRVEQIYLTVICEKFEGDAYFPNYDAREWEVTHYEEHEKDECTPYEYCYMILKRK